MSDEVARIIKLVEDGKMSSEEAGELIGALRSSSTKQSTKNYLGKMFKIRVKSGKNEKVNVNIPVRIIKTLLKMGHGIAANISEAQKYIEDLDINLVLQAIDNEIDGKIVDMQADNGDMVAIYIE